MFGVGDAPFADAGARADPLVVGIYQLRQIVVGHNPIGNAHSQSDNARVYASPGKRGCGSGRKCRHAIVSLSMLSVIS